MHRPDTSLNDASKTLVSQVFARQTQRKALKFSPSISISILGNTTSTTPRPPYSLVSTRILVPILLLPCPPSTRHLITRFGPIGSRSRLTMYRPDWTTQAAWCSFPASARTSVTVAVYLPSGHASRQSTRSIFRCGNNIVITSVSALNPNTFCPVAHRVILGTSTGFWRGLFPPNASK